MSTKDNFFKRNESVILNIVIIISVCCLIASLVPRFSQGGKTEDTIVNYINNVSDVVLGSVSVGSQTTQTFRIGGDINAINIFFSTYNRQNIGQIEVQLKQVNDGSLLYTTMLDTSTLKDNAYARFELEKPVSVPENALVMLVVNGIDGSDGNMISMNASETDVYSNGVLEVDGVEIDGDLVFNVETSTPTSQWGYWITALLITLILVAAYIIYEIIKTKAYTKFSKKQAITIISVATVLFCLGISLLAYDQAVFTAISSKTVTQDVKEETIDGIFPNIQVKQTFMVEKNFTGISLKFATYARKNIGEMEVTIRQTETGRIVHNTTISLAGLSDGKDKRINFGKTESCDSPTLYEVIVTSPVSMQDNVVTIWKSSDDSYSEGELYINGVPQNGDLCFALFGINSISSIIFYWTIVLVVTVILTALAIYLYQKYISDKEKRGTHYAAGGNI